MKGKNKQIKREKKREKRNGEKQRKPSRIEETKDIAITRRKRMIKI